MDGAAVAAAYRRAAHHAHPALAARVGADDAHERRVDSRRDAVELDDKGVLDPIDGALGDDDHAKGEAELTPLGGARLDLLDEDELQGDERQVDRQLEALDDVDSGAS